MGWRVATAILLLTLALPALLLVPVKALARPVGLYLEWRIILDEEPPEGYTPLMLGTLAGGRYIAVVGLSKQPAHSWLYVVNTLNRTVAKRLDLGPGTPLCASSTEDSLSVVIFEGRARIRELVVTPDLYLVEGIQASLGAPVLPAGCTMLGPDYLVYGSIVGESTGLDAYAILLNPGGRPIGEATMGGPGDESLYLAVPSGKDKAYAIVSNVSSQYNYTLYTLTAASGLQASPVRELSGINIVDAAYNGSLLVAGSLSTGEPALAVISANRSLLARLPPGLTVTSIAGYEPPYAYIVGYSINTSTLMLNGEALIVNTGNGEIVARSLAIGKNDVTLTASLLAGDTLYAAGLHGDAPVLLAFRVERSAPESPVQAPTTAPQPGGGMSLLALVMAALAAVVVAVLLFAVWKRRAR